MAYTTTKRNAKVQRVQFSGRSQVIVQLRLHRFKGMSVTVALHTCLHPGVKTVSYVLLRLIYRENMIKYSCLKLQGIKP